MKFNVNQDSLDHALTLAARLLPPQATMPVLLDIQMEAIAPETLKITSTDLTHRMQVIINADIMETGTAVIPGAILTKLVHRIPTATLTLKTADDGKSITLTYGRNHAKIQTEPLDVTLPEFPFHTTEELPTTWPAGHFAKLVQQTSFACSRDATRPLLQGINLQINGTRWEWAATDGSRISTVIWDADTTLSPSTITIPVKFLHETARLNMNQPVTIRMTPTIIEATTPSIQLMSRLLEGAYPNYQRVLPSEFIAHGQTSLKNLRSAMNRINVIVNTGIKSAKSMRLSFQNSQMHLSAPPNETGTIDEYIPSRKCPVKSAHSSIPSIFSTRYDHLMKRPLLGTSEGYKVRYASPQ